ncbi:MAG: hypothetical protein ABI671_07820 [Burkholderiales bacterium]
MKTKIKYVAGSLALAYSVPALSESGAICAWKIVDGVRKCVPIEGPYVIIVDPTWLVAGGVVLALLAAVTIFTALQVRNLANKSKGQRM